MELAPSPRPSPAAAGRRAPGGREKSTDLFERSTRGAGIGRKTASCRSWARRSRQNSCGCAGPVARSLPARCPKASKKLKPTTTVRSGNFVDYLCTASCESKRFVFQYLLKEDLSNFSCSL